MNTIKESSHGTSRKIATLVGVLYVIGTVAGVLSLVFAGSILDDQDYLLKVSANENQIITGALFVLIMGLALAMIPALMFPVLKKHHEGLAVGYVVFRGALETVSYMAMAISWLLLIILSQEYVKAGVPDVSYYQTLGALALRGSDSIKTILEIVFPLGALMFYYLLYRSKLIPRWLSGWGLIGAIIYLAAVLMTLFGTESEFLLAPLGVQEMVMAVWLIVKGFNVSPILDNVGTVQVAIGRT